MGYISLKKREIAAMYGANVFKRLDHLLVSGVIMVILTDNNYGLVLSVLNDHLKPGHSYVQYFFGITNRRGFECHLSSRWKV